MEGYDNRVISRVDNGPLDVKVGFTLVQLHSLVSEIILDRCYLPPLEHYSGIYMRVKGSEMIEFLAKS